MRLMNRNIYDLVPNRTIGKFEGKTVYFRAAEYITDTTFRIYATFDRNDLFVDRPTQAFSFDVEVQYHKNKANIVYVPDFIMREVW